jgi:hypothetical protein
MGERVPPAFAVRIHPQGATVVGLIFITMDRLAVIKYVQEGIVVENVNELGTTTPSIQAQSL